MSVRNLSVLALHPSPRPAAGTYNLYVLSTDGHYYLQTNTEELDLTASAVSAHNDLSSIQGGGATERYHLTAAQHTIAIQAATASLNGYLATADWNTFNNKSNYADPLTTDGDILIRDTTTKRRAAGVVNEVLTMVAGLPSWQPSFGADPTKWVVFKDDFIGTQLKSDIWTPFSSGAGSSINLRMSTAGENGVIYLTAGPSSGRYSELDFYNGGLGDEAHNFSMRRDLVLKFRVKCSSTTSILAHAGILIGTDLFIRFTADSANTNFHLQTSISSGTNDSVSTSVALDTAWHDVEIRCLYASGVYCYLDDSLVAEVTDLGRLPTTQYGFGYVRCQSKTTSSKTLDVDYYHAIQRREDA